MKSNNKKMTIANIFGNDHESLELLRKTFIKKLYKCFKHNNISKQIVKPYPLYLYINMDYEMPLGLAEGFEAVKAWALKSAHTQKQYILDKNGMVNHSKKLIKNKIKLLTKSNKKSFDIVLNNSLNYLYANHISGIFQTFIDILHSGKREIYIECNTGIAVIDSIINIAEKVINKTDGDIKIKITYIIR